MKIKSKYQFNGLAECNIEKAVYGFMPKVRYTFEYCYACRSTGTCYGYNMVLEVPSCIGWGGGS